jgi:hypothetical protein
MISSLDGKQARKNIKVKISILSKCPNQKAKNKKRRTNGNPNSNELATDENRK